MKACGNPDGAGSVTTQLVRYAGAEVQLLRDAQ